MSDIEFEAWGVQNKILKDQNRIIGAFAGKRSGKTEVGAIKSILFQEEKRNYNRRSIDPFVGAIIAPTYNMLTRLSLKKFMLYAKPFIKDFNKAKSEITWIDDSIIYGLSGDKPERIEGLKLHWAWCDEVLQMSEQLFLEVRARTSDTQGNIICTGSLGLQFINPKQHWAHKHFKERPGPDMSCYEWATVDNPHFPKDELESLKSQLDPQTFRSMFEINWDTIPLNAVYSDFGDVNVVDNYVYNPNLNTYIAIDWGYAHSMAVGFFQHDPATDSVYLFDEIIKPRMLLEDMYRQILAKPYQITDWCCDIAGSQEREQTGKSNIKWFKERGINFKTRTSAITYGISIVRSFIKSYKGQTKFYVSSQCKKSIDGLKQYRYPEKDGIIQNENPIKKDDDAVDMIRYFFVNYFDRSHKEPNARIARLR